MTLAGASDASITIATPKGDIQCRAEEIVCKRFGLNFERGCILLEYEVPSQYLLAHHVIEVDLQQGGPSDDLSDASRLKQMHGPWLAAVCPEQLSRLIGRLRAARVAPERPRRQRVQGLPPVARASKRSKVEEVQKIFDEIDVEGCGRLSMADLESYMCDYLGFGRAEASSFFKRYSTSQDQPGVAFDRFKEGYAELNPFMMMQRKQEVLLRKPGSLGGQQVNLDGLEDCEVYVCDPTAQFFIDFCKGCAVLLAPCESSVFVRDCEDCTFWIAAQQLRTNNCHRCTFYLYSKTEPIVETSTDLSFAPWSAKFPKCSQQFSQTKFDPQRNFWTAVFDFSGDKTKSNWRIQPFDEVVELCV
ncbi:unnamed protein product, partial [Polarella glacialis]